jgi:hypothetical protein
MLYYLDSGHLIPEDQKTVIENTYIFKEVAYGH